ncbi:MAG: FKBP-type peptidyl-prolyl cis-trans isomerase [Bacteroidales bacterium]|nr:FKBP-type peptidyl-prolyl cis-trans isomerase [Bacteroidales bacterium]MDZ4205229.1 FKBP-type peptidyl-prolyl cis-trans isomerase [Bacteroidales bacterium]
MYKLYFPLFVTAFLCTTQPVLAQKNTKKQAPKPITETVFRLNNYLDSVNYIIGTDIGYTLKNNGLEIQPESLIQGLRDALQGIDTLFSLEQAETIVRAYTSKLSEKQQQSLPSSTPASIETGDTFLADNRKNPAVTETSSGLQYMVIEAGEGSQPKPTDQVTVHYRGTLLDGTVFDSSYDRGTPATFELGRLIPGWVEGIQLMKPGAKFVFFIPPNLGYGDRNIGEIPPNSVLVFEVELISF